MLKVTIMEPDYPENTVWYIEARRWSGTKENPGFVKRDPVTRGSGVVITFSKLLDNGDREPRSYILTCAHVVRNNQDQLLEDIICYPPGKGFVRTAATARQSGTFPEALVRPAKVSQLSPCRGEAGPRPTELKRDAALDWVLLEIDDPSFYHQQSVAKLRTGYPTGGQALQVIGFPFGAGLKKDKGSSVFWKNGKIVRAAKAKDFRPTEQSNPGLVDYEGPEETRPGMSGGGIFDDTGSLVGIHRSTIDAAMRRGGIRADAVARYLKDRYNLEVAGNQVAAAPEEHMPSLSTPTAELLITVNRITSNFGIAPVKGLKVGFEPLDNQSMKGTVTEGETDASGRAVIKFTAENQVDDVFGYLICRNQPSGTGNDTLLILSPYGKLADGLTKEKPLRLPFSETIYCTVLGHKAYLHEYLLKFLPSVPTNDVENKIADAAVAAGLSNKEKKLATEGWVERLKQERPVVRFPDMEEFFKDEAPGIRKIAESVGRVVSVDSIRSNVNFFGTAFLIAENLVLLPEFVLRMAESVPESSGIRVDFSHSDRTENRVVSKVIWRSGTTESIQSAALCEIPESTKKPLTIGMVDTASNETKIGRMEIAVFGFPQVDQRLPDELNEYIAPGGDHLAVMPGEISVHQAGAFEIFHDATTSGGVSGGPVVHRQSNTVIAMHIGGRFADVKKENYAFNLQALWNNPSFVEALQPYNVTTETIGARVNRDWIRSGDFIQTAPPSLNVGSKIITN
ncbi:Trypsin-like peptidase domain-containing protein [Candidatus Electrothrix aarhusensis]|uniref:Trypsin-like peptidase domain-containing protein n=1 Tax=Candidatus Electrothrix aarhusensis TaxID=1859131 RepID=A0A3S3QUS2_9BACT|nr:Trypsin-like peptidase domain-containing protein [Candidatus Electrothrix aarhusensis]